MKKWLVVAVVALLVLGIATPAMAKPAAKPVVVSHPYSFAYRHKIGSVIHIWGFVRPRSVATTEATVTIVVQRREGHGSWVATSGLDTTASLAAHGMFKHAENYKAALTIGRTGRYRIRAVLEWTDTKGNVHVRRSTWRYYRIVK